MGHTGWAFARQKPLGAFGVLALMLMVAMAAFSPQIATQNPSAISNLQFAGPSTDHWLGTDNLGRDIYSRLIFGARVSVTVGFLSVAILVTIATSVGIASGYFGGKVDTVLQRIVDAVMALPNLPILMAAVLLFPPSIYTIAIVLGVLSGPQASRVIRGATMSLAQADFIIAARALGSSHSRIMLVHILPNLFAPVMVVGTVFLGGAILAEAALSFLGLGSPEISWGKMLGLDSLIYMRKSPWMAFSPGVAIALVVFGVNMLGDALRDVLDPRLRGTGR